jgi:hypothetical protein
MNAARTTLTLSAMLAALSFPAAAARAEIGLWDHNGSLIRLDEQDKKRRLIYEHPRNELTLAGVKPGTVLFDGEIKSDGRMSGYAKLFRKGCAPVDYYVEGPFDKTKGEIVLQGQAPVYSGQGCKITGYTEEGSASTLKFTLQDAGGGYYADGSSQTSGNARPSYLPPAALGGPDDPNDPSAPPPQEKRRSAYNDPQADESAPVPAPRPAPPPASTRSSRNDAQNDPRYDDHDPGYDPRRDRDEAYDPRYDERDYASREDRRYDRSGAYDPPPRVRRYEPDDYYDDEYRDEPAYRPYQPWWRRRYY